MVRSYYVLDTARVFPPETPLRIVLAIVIPCGSRQALRLLPLGDQTWQQDLSAAIGFHASTEPGWSVRLQESALFFDRDSTQPVNDAATRLARREIRGVAVVVQVRVWLLLRWAPYKFATLFDGHHLI